MVPEGDCQWVLVLYHLLFEVVPLPCNLQPPSQVWQGDILTFSLVFKILGFDMAVPEGVCTVRMDGHCWSIVRHFTPEAQRYIVMGRGHPHRPASPPHPMFCGSATSLIGWQIDLMFKNR